jgi:hypothetical protein
MSIDNAATQSRKRLSKAKIIFLVGALVVAVLVVAHVAWKYSGSNKWELVLDKNGVQVYAVKVPGVAKKQFKAVTRIKTTLNRIVTAMTDTSTEACREFVPTCTSGEVLEPWNPQNQYLVQAFRVDLPRPLSPRDLVIKTEFHQDPQSKSLLIRCTALPDRIPPNECCVRIKNVHNTWRYTPVEDGEIEVEFSSNAESPIPYFVANLLAPSSGVRLFSRLEKFYNRDKYQHTEFAFVREPLQ